MLHRRVNMGHEMPIWRREGDILDSQVGNGRIIATMSDRGIARLHSPRTMLSAATAQQL